MSSSTSIPVTAGTAPKPRLSLAQIFFMSFGFLGIQFGFALQNGNGGLINHSYYDKERYWAKLKVFWPMLQEKKLVRQNLEEIKNTDFFKYSPYKALTEDQLLVAEKIEAEIKKDVPVMHIVNGSPGTGKSILPLYLLKHLKEQ